MRGSRRREAEVKAVYRLRVRSMSFESRHVADDECVSSAQCKGLEAGGNGEEDVRRSVGCPRRQDQHREPGGAWSVTLSVQAGISRSGRCAGKRRSGCVCKVRTDLVSISVDEIGRTSGAIGAFGEKRRT